MRGNELDPQYAAEMADNVYMVKDQAGRKVFSMKYKNDLNLGDGTWVYGKTGALLVLKKTHVLAVLSTGIGRYKGQAFVVFKGTANLYDVLTDINTGVKTSHTGCLVHQGFHQAFNSVLTELRQFISGLEGIHTIHCVGHSLGGAIATLAADWINVSGAGASTKLYTFGSPRVGLDIFARKCTARVKTGNIYRVHHQTDPVPMVPTWPFSHVPTHTTDYLVWSPISAIPWKYHAMEHYINSAKQAGSWEAMKKNRPQNLLDSAVERWLKSEGVLSFSASTLELLSASFLYVLKKVTNGAGIIVVGGFTTTFTLLDRMAILMAKAAKLSIEVSAWVYHLLKKMAALAGVVVKKGANLTVEFIRVVFLKLHQKISIFIWHAGKEVG